MHRTIKPIYFILQERAVFPTFSNIPNVAAICVYPNFVPLVKKTHGETVKIASVAGLSFITDPFNCWLNVKWRWTPG